MSAKPKLATCLKMLGISPALVTFDERKLLQKLVYLMQMFGIRLGFHYSWYIHGPYSPGLTRTLYEMIEPNKVSHGELSESEIAEINELKSSLGADIHSSDSLELIVSILYLKEQIKGSGASEGEIIQAIKKVKPYFSDKQLRESWRKAAELEKLARLSRRI